MNPHVGTASIARTGPDLQQCAEALGVVLDADDGILLPMLALESYSGYGRVVHATAIVHGKVVRFRLPASLARAQKRNAGKTMTDQEAVAFVEEKRRELALRRAKPYLESRS